MYKNISDYGLIGDMHSVALVSSDGSIDYCSMPHIDSPTVFAALLDDEKGGFFSIKPRGKFSSRQEYIKDTNILSCSFRTDKGIARLIDFMPASSKYLFDKKDHVIHRCLKVESGELDFELEFYPRPQYATGLPHIERLDDVFNVKNGNRAFFLILKLDKYELKESQEKGLVIHFSLNMSQEAHFDFVYGDRSLREAESCSLNETIEFWQSWIHNCVAEKCSLLGEHTAMINRSLLALKILTFQPTGAIVAAPTTSLPESLEGTRNWDYRFTWIRDASFTLRAFFSLGHIAEADSFIHWLHGIYKQHGSRDLQIMYSLKGEHRLGEKILRHLKGYKNSKPVRIGNDAYRQSQWDIYGEVMDAALRLSDYAGMVDEELWPFFKDICNFAINNWAKPDKGIWEVRNGPYHFVYSKVMCWVALDRGIKIARRYGFDAPLEEWKKQRIKIKQDILEKGYDRDIQSFVQYYGSQEADASLFLLPILNFLPINDLRIQNTIEYCKKNLMQDGFLMRYTSKDGLKGKEGAFVLCNFWLIECLARLGKINEAQDLLNKTLQAANHLGLFSEEYDLENQQMLGNFPQAFSHLGFINAVSAILNVGHKMLKEQTPASRLNYIKKLTSVKFVLNKTNKKLLDTNKDIAAQLKIALNNLQGAFFYVELGKVNYEAMKKSESYNNYTTLAEKLHVFDPLSLETDEEKKAFWINIYNILIIHGVIELDINNSVKEVFNFFRRIGYSIGGLFFTPDDIEHGILRSNRAHPILKLKQFSWLDKRKELCVNKLDPRIHFALVCAASSCPPIEFYDSGHIDKQLDTAGKSFLNRGGAVLDRDHDVVYLSQIFQWYLWDFGKNKEGLLNYVLKFLSEENKSYILDNKSELKVKYLPYDWHLNKELI